MNKIDLCKTIQMNVSKLTESENLELFKIILDTNANYTKNNNGIFLNLNWIDEKLLVKINNYILFCIKSQNEISKYELMKTLLNDSINTKDTNEDENVLLETARVASCTGKYITRNASTSDANTIGDANDDANAKVAVDNIGGSIDSSGQVIAGNSTNPKQKFSSSMKFYLLKKKFMKQNTCYNACLENDLTYEDYLIT